MKNILLCVLGLTPQVITETLYALHQQDRKIDAIHVITTRLGKEKLYANLLSPKDGQYYAYLREYDIDRHSIAFGWDHIHTITDYHGVEIDDIEDEESNEWLLEKCLDLTFEFTKNPETTVFFSIAGGRKTMSACLMVAAQFYGRPQDRVFHVLVSSEFESNRDFYFPPKINTPIALRDGNGQSYTKDSKYAELKILSIPFVTVRDKLSDKMLKEPKKPAELLLSLVKEEHPQLIIDLSNAKLIYRKKELDMMPARLAIYAFFAMQKKNCAFAIGHSCRNCTNCYLDFGSIENQQDELIALYHRCDHSREVSEMSKTGIKGLTLENFYSYKTKIKKDLKDVFGPTVEKQLTIEGCGKKPDTRYGIKIDRENIKVIL